MGESPASSKTKMEKVQDLQESTMSNEIPISSSANPPSKIKQFLQGYPRWREGVFLTSIAGMGMLFGFGASIASAKKQDPTGFDIGMTPSRKHDSGVALATRALKWGTIYAVGGCGILFFTIWKLIGANDLQEFRMKVGKYLPQIPKKESQGRTEFSSLTDLLQYIIDEDERLKAVEKSKIIVHNSAEINNSNIDNNNSNDKNNSQAKDSS